MGVLAVHILRNAFFAISKPPLLQKYVTSEVLLHLRYY